LRPLDCQGPRFKHWSGQKSDSRFMLHAHPKNPATGTKKWYLCRSQVWKRREGW